MHGFCYTAKRSGYSHLTAGRENARAQATSECTTGTKVGSKWMGKYLCFWQTVLVTRASLNRAVSEPTDSGIFLGL